MTTKQKQAKQPDPQVVDTQSSTAPEQQHGALATTVSSQPTAASGMKNLAAALAKAQAECQNVVMNKTNPHFRSRYADLAAVRDAIIPVFNKHGLSIIQAPTDDGFAGFHLDTILIHSSGESMSWSFPLPHDVNKMQSIGSAISYARRYTLSAIAGVASEEDDDGNAATSTHGGRQPTGAAGSSASYGAAGVSANGGSPSGQGGIVL
jgi:hypothetical protein